MVRSRLLLVVTLALATLLGSANAEDDATPDVRTYGLWLKDTRVGFARSSLTKIEIDGKPGWRYRSEMKMRIATGRGVHETQSDKVTEFRDDATPVRSFETEIENGNERVTRITYGPSTAVKEEEFLGRTRRLEVEIDGTILVEHEVYLHRMCRDGKMAAGARFEVRKVAFLQEKTYAAFIDVVERVEQPDGSVAWRIRTSDELDEGVELEVLADHTGRMIEGRFGPLSVRLVDPEDEEFDGQFEGDLSTVHSTPVIVSSDVSRVRAMTIDVEIDDEDAAFRPDGYQQVAAKDGSRHRLSLVPNRPDPDQSLELPVKVDRLALFLRESEDHESDSPEIRAKAAELVGPEKNGAVVLETLCQWVFESLEKLSNGTGLTARETLEACKGDCTEHASLFIALARAAGLPAREMSGLKFSGNGFVRHAWAEAWLGTWIPVDPAWGTVGTTAGYISLGPDIDEDGVSRGAALNMALFSNVTIRILDVDLDGQVFSAVDQDDVLVLPDDPDAVVEHVLLRSGLAFAGRQIGFEHDRLVFQTPYGRASVARTDIARIRYGRGMSRGYDDPELGVTFELPGDNWAFTQPEQRSFVCQFEANDENAVGVLMVEEFDGTLASYVQAVQGVIAGVEAETSRVEMVEIHAGEDRVPAARWSFAIPGSALTYEFLIVLRGTQAFRLMLWTSTDMAAQYGPQMRTTLDSFRLSR